jgi:hypothetical protein
MEHQTEQSVNLALLNSIVGFSSATELGKISVQKTEQEGYLISVVDQFAGLYRKTVFSLDSRGQVIEAAAYPCFSFGLRDVISAIQKVKNVTVDPTILDSLVGFDGATEIGMNTRLQKLPDGKYLFTILDRIPNTDRIIQFSVNPRGELESIESKQFENLDWQEIPLPFVLQDVIAAMQKAKVGNPMSHLIGAAITYLRFKSGIVHTSGAETQGPIVKETLGNILVLEGKFDTGGNYSSYGESYISMLEIEEMRTSRN